MKCFPLPLPSPSPLLSSSPLSSSPSPPSPPSPRPPPPFPFPPPREHTHTHTPRHRTTPHPTPLHRSTIQPPFPHPTAMQCNAMRDVWCGMWDVGCGVWGVGFGIWICALDICGYVGSEGLEVFPVLSLGDLGDGRREMGEGRWEILLKDGSHRIPPLTDSDSVYVYVYVYVKVVEVPEVPEVGGSGWWRQGASGKDLSFIDIGMGIGVGIGTGKRNRGLCKLLNASRWTRLMVGQVHKRMERGWAIVLFRIDDLSSGDSVVIGAGAGYVFSLNPLPFNVQLNSTQLNSTQLNPDTPKLYLQRTLTEAIAYPLILHSLPVSTTTTTTPAALIHVRLFESSNVTLPIFEHDSRTLRTRLADSSNTTRGLLERDSIPGPHTSRDIPNRTSTVPPNCRTSQSLGFNFDSFKGWGCWMRRGWFEGVDEEEEEEEEEED
ncbi:hypothetical protein F5877DRAFT_69836 [Lentinula edodes]|nr:hypothetical protein F5877DRAFT_69836 [Lentinula edodes]